MKTIVVEKPTRNVDGLLVALRKNGAVITVASDRVNTYVYTEDASDVDFTPLVESWEDEAELCAETDGVPAPDGVPVVEANGYSVHTVVVRKTTPKGEGLPGNEKIVVATPQPVKLKDAKFRLVNGTASFTVGPSSKLGDVYLRIRDGASRLRETRLHIRFGEVRPLPPPEAAPEPLPVVVEERNDLWSKIRRTLRI